MRTKLLETIDKIRFVGLDQYSPYLHVLVPENAIDSSLLHSLIQKKLTKILCSKAILVSISDIKHNGLYDIDLIYLSRNEDRVAITVFGMVISNGSVKISKLPSSEEIESKVIEE